MSDEEWIPIESNPEVMNKFLANVGVPTDEWSIVDVFSLDEDLLPFICGPVLSLILCFPTEMNPKIVVQTNDNHSKDVYSMRQTIHNVCGTIALMHSVANNCDRIRLKPDSSLKTFLDSSQQLSPEERAKLMESSEDILEAHRKASREGQTAVPNYRPNNHYLALVHRNGSLYELDGRKPPVNHGKTSEESFLSDAARVCRQFIAKDPNNLTFNVLALTRNMS